MYKYVKVDLQKQEALEWESKGDDNSRICDPKFLEEIKTKEEIPRMMPLHQKWGYYSIKKSQEEIDKGTAQERK